MEYHNLINISLTNGNRKGYKVYTPSFDAEGDYWVGIPNYILIDSTENIRRANTDEVQEILVSLPDE